MLEYVLAQLRSRKGRRTGNLRDVARDTGLDYSWLTKLADEPTRIPEPGVNKIQVLHDHFKSEEEREPA